MENVNETYESYALAERDAFKAYRQGYALQYPPPEKPTIGRVARDSEFILLLLTVISSILLTSLRTAEAFYKSAQYTALVIFGIGVAQIEAALAIIAVEGMMVVLSMIRAKKRKTTHSELTYVVGIIILATISVVAALNQSISLMENPSQQVIYGLSVILTIVIGPGSALSALLGGHLLGSRISDLSAENQELMKQYKEDRSAWEQKVVASWNTKKRKIVGSYSVEDDSSTSKTSRSPEPIHEEEPEPEQKQWGRGELQEAIMEWLEENRIDLYSPLNYAQIAEEIGHSNPESVRVTIEQKLRKS